MFSRRAPLGDLAHHDGRQLGVSGDPGDDGLDDGVELGFGVAVAHRDGAHLLAAALEHLPKHRAIEAGLAPEVVVDHRLVDAGVAGDEVDAGRGIAAGGEFTSGGIEDRLARQAGGLARPAAAGAGRADARGGPSGSARTERDPGRGSKGVHKLTS